MHHRANCRTHNTNAAVTVTVTEAKLENNIPEKKLFIWSA